MLKILFSFLLVINQIVFAEDTVKSLTNDLGGIFEGTRVTNTKSVTPMKMIREYVKKVWGDEDAREFRYVQNANYFEMDNKVAGTLEVNATQSMVLTSIDDYLSDSLKEVKENARSILSRLLRQDVIFGFDGWQQNRCAAPTPYLLVLDTKNKVVYGINLFPCEE